MCVRWASAPQLGCSRRFADAVLSFERNSKSAAEIAEAALHELGL
jgi:hypothetical protein